MTLTPPPLDARSYDDLVAEALRRIPAHTPEWTNFHHADVGVTLVELFAFLAESAIYRANLVPERNRRAFVELLGLPRAPGRPAQGLVTLAPPRSTAPVPVPTGLEVFAGSVPFRLTSGLDVLPVEALAVVREGLVDPPAEIVTRHKRMYQLGDREDLVSEEPALYRTVPVGQDGRPTPLSETVDRCVWIALLVPEPIARTTNAAEVRREIAGRTLSVGVVAAPSGPAAADARAASSPAEGAPPPLTAELPRTGQVVLRDGRPHVEWATAPSVADHDLLAEPGVLHVTLPGEFGLQAVTGADPLEAGVGELPPDLQDPELEARVVTWLRLRAPTSSSARIVWTGVNAATVSQRGHVTGEPVATGTGRPDQQLRLARTPVVPGSVRLRVDEPGGLREWREIGDLLDAAGEVALVPRTGAPGAGTEAELPRPDRVFTLSPADGVLRFGDGRHGRRPPADATISADYDFALGAAGNVPAEAITSAPALPTGVKVTNPVRTWGGADPESVADAERHAVRFLQHRERLVTPEDIEAIALRTPGVDVGRVEVLSCYDPQLGPMPPGDAAGCVTVLVVPRHDPVRPETPAPDQAFLDTVCRAPRPAPARHDRAVRARSELRRPVADRRLPPGGGPLPGRGRARDHGPAAPRAGRPRSRADVRRRRTPQRLAAGCAGRAPGAGGRGGPRRRRRARHRPAHGRRSGRRSRAHHPRRPRAAPPARRALRARRPAGPRRRPRRRRPAHGHSADAGPRDAGGLLMRAATTSAHGGDAAPGHVGGAAGAAPVRAGRATVAALSRGGGTPPTRCVREAAHA